MLCALGGTIAMAPDGRGGVVPALAAADLVAAVPQLGGLDVDLDVVDLRRLPGASLGFADLAEVAATVRGARAAGAAGVVVTQGTDTIEESATWLDLVDPGPEPVVVTGAMRSPTMAGADGPANLLAAVTVAADPGARGRGCLVVMADEIHAARRVRKAHTSHVAAFRSPDGGPLGYVVAGTPVFANRLDHRFVVPAPGPGPGAPPPPRVALVTMALGDDGALLDGLADRVDGVVVAGFGAGHVPEALVEALHGLATRRPVVLASRAGAGPVLLTVYAYPGSESDLVERGLIPAGFLDPLKARVLLHLALGAGADRETVARAFAAAGGYGDPAAWPWPSPAARP